MKLLQHPRQLKLCSVWARIGCLKWCELRVHMPTVVTVRYCGEAVPMPFLFVPAALDMNTLRVLSPDAKCGGRSACGWWETGGRWRVRR